MRHKPFLLAALLLLTAVAYMPSYQGEFQFDDDIFISESAVIGDSSQIFQRGALGALASGLRPLTQLSLNMNYALGGLHVTGYHVFNVLVHLMVTLLVYAFSLRIFRVLSGAGDSGDRPEGMALAAAAVFALHPVQTQAVSYVIQRAESLASLFYLMGLLSLIQFTGSQGWQKWAFWLCGLLFSLLGLGSKEIIVTLPLVFLLFAGFFMDRPHFRTALKGISPFILGGCVLVIWRLQGFRGSVHAGFDIQGLNQLEYFFTQARVLLTYVRLIFLPIAQTLDYDYPIQRNVLSGEVLGLVLFWVLVLLCSFSTLRMQGRWKWHARIMGFGVLWFLVILLPTSSLIPLKDVIYEHRLYLPMLGPVIAALAAGDILMQKIGEHYGGGIYGAAPKMLAGVVLMLGLLTFTRSMVWQTKLSLWQDVVAKAPHKSRGYNNVGNCYYLQGNYEGAVEQYRAAVERGPDFFEAYYNLAMSLEKTGRQQEAVYYYLAFAEKAPAEYDRIKKDIRVRYGLSR